MTWINLLFPISDLSCLTVCRSGLFEIPESDRNPNRSLLETPADMLRTQDQIENRNKDHRKISGPAEDIFSDLPIGKRKSKLLKAISDKNCDRNLTRLR